MNEIPKAVLEIINNDPETLVAFVYGSRVESFSNKYSDLDICVITKNRVKSNFLSIQDTEVQIESIPLSQLEDMIATAQQAQFNQIAVLWCHRINTGIPIYDPQGIFKQLREKIDLNSISQNLAMFYSGQSTLFLNDSLGAFESEDFETAIITARLGVESAAMAYLSSIGIINPKTKWIYRYLLKVKKTEKDEIVEQFKTLERACVNGVEEIRRYIALAADFINKMTTQAQVPT